MTNILDLHKVRYETQDKNHIKVTYLGAYDENWNYLENELNNAGMYAVKRTYDKKNNKTVTIYKRT